MAYNAGEPLGGFSLIIDGQEDAIRAILDAVIKEMSRQFAIAESESERLSRGVFADRIGHYQLPVYPVRGEIHLRTG